MWGCFVSPWLVPYTQGVHQNGCYVHPDLVSRQTKQAFNPHKSLSFGSVSIFLSLLLHRIVLSYSRLLPLCKTLLRRSESWIGPWRSAVTDVVYCVLLRVEHVLTCQRLAFFSACCSRPVRPFSSPADSLLSSHTPRPVRSPKDSRSPLMYTTCQPPQRVSYSMQWLHLPHRLFLVLCSVWYIFFFSPSISLSIQLRKRLQGIYGWISVSTLTKSPEPLRT